MLLVNFPTFSLEDRHIRVSGLFFLKTLCSCRSVSTSMVSISSQTSWFRQRTTEMQVTCSRMHEPARCGHEVFAKSCAHENCLLSMGLYNTFLKNASRRGKPMALGFMWHVCDGWMRAHAQNNTQLMREKSEPPHMGSNIICRSQETHLPNSLVSAWHGAPFVKCHVFWRGWPRGLLAWMATWFYLWSYGLFLFLTTGRRYCPTRDVRSTNRALTCRALTCKRWIQTSWWQHWSVCLFPRVSWEISNAPYMRLCHAVSEPSGLMKPHHLVPQCSVAMWNWQVRVGKRIFNSAVAPLFVTWSTSPCGAAEFTSHQMHYSTVCTWQVFRNSPFLGIWRDIVVGSGFTIARDPPGRGAWAGGLADLLSRLPAARFCCRV